ncbi:MAG: hypothetical protein GY730_07330 [bacterium]|nr:hypothetical protein [bacterium]
MDSVAQIISDNTDWKEAAIVSFAKKNRVEVRQKDNLIMLSYEEDIPNEGWNDFNRQCRGIIFDMKRRSLVAHPFDKFFNFDSHPETKYDILPFSTGYEISVKYDGTMLTACSHDNTVRFATRASFENFQTEMATQIFQERFQKLRDVDFTRYTLIFELVTPANLLIVQYNYNDLVLIGIRDLLKNQMLSYSQVAKFAENYDLKPPMLLEKDFFSIYETAKEGKDEIVEEGWVVKFGNGLYVKLKTWQYLAHMQIKRRRLTKKHLIRNYCEMTNQKWLDFIKKLPPDTQNTVIQFGEEVQLEINAFSEEMHTLFRKFSDISIQKDFAFTIQKEVPQKLHSYLFVLRAGKSLERLIRKKYKEVLKEDSFEEAIHPVMIKGWSFQQKD